MTTNTTQTPAPTALIMQIDTEAERIPPFDDDSKLRTWDPFWRALMMLPAVADLDRDTILRAIGRHDEDNPVTYRCRTYQIARLSEMGHAQDAWERAFNFAADLRTAMRKVV